MRAALAVIPTYNEKDNIADLIQAVIARDERIQVVVVDDDSPDGTAACVEPLVNDRVHLIVRTEGKGGRGSAVRHGFRWGLDAQRGFDVLFEMDSDFSHRPEEIDDALALMERQDAERPALVLGSRYRKTSRIVGWPASRRIFSRLSNFMARVLLGNLASDFTNGFRFYNLPAATLLCESPQRHKGFIYLSECLCTLKRNGAVIVDFPTVFENRVRGESNTTLSEVRQALFGVFSIAVDHRLRQMKLRR